MTEPIIGKKVISVGRFVHLHNVELAPDATYSVEMENDGCAVKFTGVPVVERDGELMFDLAAPSVVIFCDTEVEIVGDE